LEEKMRLTTVLVPECYLNVLDFMVKKGFYPDRAEAIRFAIKNLIDEHLSFEEKNIRRAKKVSHEG